jgi:hypothetical protein
MGKHFHLLVKMIPEYKFSDEEIEMRFVRFYGDDRVFTDALIPSLRTKLSSLSEFVREIKVGFARYYNKRHTDALIIDILDNLTLEERVSIADLDENEHKTLQLVMGKYMKYRLDRLNEQGNDALLKECRDRSGDESLDDVGASVFILKVIWKKLREAHRIRVVK